MKTVDSFAGAQEKPFGQQHHGHSRPGWQVAWDRTGNGRFQALFRLSLPCTARNCFHSHVAVGVFSPERALCRNLRLDLPGVFWVCENAPQNFMVDQFDHHFPISEWPFWDPNFLDNL